MYDKLIIDPGKGRKPGEDNSGNPDGSLNENGHLQEGQENGQQNGSMNGQSHTGRGSARTASRSGTIEADEIVWGNDRSFLSSIDEGHRAELRLFVRIRYIQKITCSIVYDSISAEPYELDEPLEFMIVDLSVGGIGVICEQEIEIGKIVGVQIVLDAIPYDVKCEVVYCIPLDGKFRAGLKIAHKDKAFMRHLKIFVARISLTSAYASGE